MNLVTGFPLLQRPVTQVNKKLHIRELHLDVPHNTREREMEYVLLLIQLKREVLSIKKVYILLRKYYHTIGKTLLPTMACKCMKMLCILEDLESFV